MAKKEKPEVKSSEKDVEVQQNLIALANESLLVDEDTAIMVWKKRRARMEQHRKQFEDIWRSGYNNFIFSVFQGEDASEKLYNQIYEQYDSSLYSKEGLKFGGLKYPLIPAIILRAMATEYNSRPKARWTAYGSNNPDDALVFTHLFNQVLADMDADEEDFEIMLDRRIRGTSAVFQYTDKYEFFCREPEAGDDGEIKYKTEKKKYEQVMYKKIDLRHTYLDEKCKKTNLKDCKYAQLDTFLGKEEFIVRYAYLGEEKIQKALETGTVSGTDANSNSELFQDDENAEFMKITHCFDKVQDAYHIICGDALLNDLDQPIPRKSGKRGKDIPIALAIQYKIPGCPYGYSDSNLTRSFNAIKDLVRLILLEATQKMSKPLLAVAPESAFDEQGFEWGDEFIRVNPSDLQQVQISPNFKALYDLDNTTDNDVTRVTGINISDTTNIDVNETARKTIIRRESQNAIIELSMSYLAVSFYKRLYELMADDILLHYRHKLKSGEEVTIKTKDSKMIRDKKGGVDLDESVKGTRYFTAKDKDLDNEMDLDLEIGNIAVSRELEKALAMEILELAGKSPDMFNMQGLANYLKDTWGMPDSVVNKQDVDIDDQDPEEIANSKLSPEEIPKSMDKNFLQSLMPQNEQQGQMGAGIPE